MDETKRIALAEAKETIAHFNHQLESLKRDIDNLTDLGFEVKLSYDLPGRFEIEIFERV